MLVEVRVQPDKVMLVEVERLLLVVRVVGQALRGRLEEQVVLVFLVQ